MKTRNIKRQFENITNLKYKNLIVSGCSFTYNNSEDSSVTWPYYLRDLGNIDQVYDCSLPGAGNYHICHSTIWALENYNFDIDNTIVIVMWSGNNRDDLIVSSDQLNCYPMNFNFTKNASSGISGGNHKDSRGNVPIINDLTRLKSLESRSIENYLYITTLYNYMIQKQYKFLFLNYLDQTAPNRGNDFEISEFLSNKLLSRYKSYFTKDIENLYKFSIKRNLLGDDDFHPSPDAHLMWAREILLPYIIKNC